MNFLKQTILIFATFIIIPFISAEERPFIERGKSGDFILYQSKNLGMAFIIGNCRGSHMCVEQIDVPWGVVAKKSKKELIEWLQSGARGHTHWSIYEIDLEKHAVVEAYSFTERSFLLLDQGFIFEKLLQIQEKNRLSDALRKKIGPMPRTGVDRRKLWAPPHPNNSLADIKVYRSMLDREFQGYHIDLYFDQTELDFPFPYWVEVADSGGVKLSFMGKWIGHTGSMFHRTMPRKMPYFTEKGVVFKENKIIFSLCAPSYWDDFTIALFDAKQKPHLVSCFTLQRENDKLVLEVNEADLPLLADGVYEWRLFCHKPEVVTLESREVLVVQDGKRSLQKALFH